MERLFSGCVYTGIETLLYLDIYIFLKLRSWCHYFTDYVLCAFSLYLNLLPKLSICKLGLSIVRFGLVYNVHYLFSLFS